MLRTEPFRSRAQMKLSVPGLGLLLLSLTAAAASGSPSTAARQIDCSAVNEGALNVELSGTARTSRVVVLRAGEALNFTFASAASPFVSLTVVEGAESPRPLLAGPSGTKVEFVAPAQDTF